MDLSSKLLENAVEEIANLPSIGKRTALRLALHMLKQQPEFIKSFTQSIEKLALEIKYCTECNNLSDNPICGICSNPNRQKNIICIVEDIRDVMAIENTQQYRGVYHVLGGKISPMEGIGPNDLAIEPFIEKINRGEIKEVIFALDSTMEGDTTNFYIYKQIADTNVLISSLSKGIAVGGELEYVDEITLGRSILNRVPFEDTFIKEI